MKTTYRFTIRKPTYCPFSGLHHADGHLLVLEDASLSFFSPDPAGAPGRQLTDPRPLKSESDIQTVRDWLRTAVSIGIVEEVGARAAAAQAAPAAATKAEPPKAESKKLAESAKPAEQPKAPPPPGK